MKRFLQICLLLFGLFLLVWISPFVYWQFIFTRGRTEHGLAADRAVLQAGMNLSKKYGLYPESFGGSCVKQAVTSFALGVRRYGPEFDQDEARELVLECARFLQKFVNEDPEVRK